MRTTFFSTLLFWLTVLAGTAALAPCLLLPALFERQAQAEYLRAQEQYVAALRVRIQSVHKQIEHLNNDPAYVVRLAQQEFGGVFKVPNVETILIEPGAVATPDAAAPVEPAGAAAQDQEPLLPELDTFIADVWQRYPRAQIFVDPRTRPALMLGGGALLVAGIVVLGLLSGPPRKGGS